MVSLTSLSVAAQRAIETERPQALFRDPFARALAGSEGFRVAHRLAALSHLPTAMDGPSMFAVRTRFFDDRIIAASRAGTAQVVVVAAGMDTRAQRLELPPDTELFELDRRVIFDHKEPILAELGATARCGRHVVAADVSQDWQGPLAAAGFDASVPTVWVIEGFLYYLAPSVVHDLLDAVGDLSPPGSTLLADVAPTAMSDAPGLQNWRDEMTALGEPWQFFTDDGRSLLATHGWIAEAHSVLEIAVELGVSVSAIGTLRARRLLSAHR